MNCRHCTTDLAHTFLDLGAAPLSNAYLSEADLRRPEPHYPLRLFVCPRCWLVQTEDVIAAADVFTDDYAYFSSTSTGWLEHARLYCQDIVQRLGLDQDSWVVEVACNDGYLLRNFIDLGIPCLGIEPTATTAAAAEALGIPVLREFFGEARARQLRAKGRGADLIVGNNVFAHVPDINDFAHGLRALLSPAGTVTLEFPHLMRLIEQVQFDTVYHEHFSYLSLRTACTILASAGLRVFDVEQLRTHGGSLRVYACHSNDPRPTQGSVATVLDLETDCGMTTLTPYLEFQARANEVKDGLLSFLLECKRLRKTVAAYGAAAKGNTLLNYAGVRGDLVGFVCDASLSKQGRYLPGSRIPIVSPAELSERQPDTLLILPWNIAAEVRAQQQAYLARGGRMVVAIPRLARLA
jgi:hypothetical protein